jgi:hypothetical protein
MAVRCRVSTDTNSGFLDLDFAAVPRVGEHISLPGADGPQDFRVTRVLHTPGPGLEPVIVDVTSKLL